MFKKIREVITTIENKGNNTVYTTIESSDDFTETTINTINDKNRFTENNQSLYEIDSEGNKKLVNETSICINTDRKGRATHSVTKDKNHKTGLLTTIFTKNKRKRMKAIVNRMIAVIKETDKYGNETEYVDNDSFILESDILKLKRYKNPTGNNLISILIDGDIELNVTIGNDYIKGGIDLLDDKNRALKSFNMINNKFEERELNNGLITSAINKEDGKETNIDINYDINSLGKCKKIERVNRDTGEIMSFSLYDEKDNSKTTSYYMREKNM